MSATTVVSKAISESIAILIATHDQEINIKTLITTHNATANLSTTGISNSSISTTGHLLTAATNNLSATVPVNLSNTPNSNIATKLISKWNPKTENDTTKLEIDNGKDAASSKQKTNQKPLTSNIPPATSTENKLLAAIFPFELEEITSVLLFSGAALDTKPITMMYTDTNVNGQYIKLILNSGLAGSIITKQLINQLGYQVDRAASTRIITANRATKTFIGEIDNFSFEVNGITVPIKVLVIKATQYQALVELALSQNGRHTWVPVACGHFKTTTITTPLIKFEEEKKNLPEKSTKYYDQGKGKQKETELIWNTNNNWEINKNQKEIRNWEWKENKNRKRKTKTKEKESLLTAIYAPYIHPLPQLINYHRPKLVCVNCSKKLSTIGACYDNDEEYSAATKFYCHACIIKRFGRLKKQEKWDNQLCFACGKTFLDKGIGTCDKLCQYMILISDWIRKETPIKAAWRRAVQ
ncbi:hypothetical protein G9A89_004982 [Geosiphon pyriformis]|nr:hypothetical protein G9A89_004982 [Geosiphon pyriformis]